MDELRDLLTRKLVALPLESALTLASQTEIGRLVTQGWLVRSALVMALPEPTGPITTWMPATNEQMPPGRVVYLAQKLWAAATPQNHTILTATQKSASLTGGTPGRIRIATLAHDLALALVYFRLPASLRESWMPERALKASEFHKRYGFVPDALCGAEDLVAIDVIGAGYTPARVQKIQDGCVRVRIAYQLW